MTQKTANPGEKALLGSYYLATSAASVENFDRLKHLLANESGKLLECDRVTVAAFVNSAPRIVAVTGLAEVNTASEHARTAAKMLKLFFGRTEPAIVARRMLDFEQNAGKRKIVASYLEAAGTYSAVWFPFVENGVTVGGLLMEMLSDKNIAENDVKAFGFLSKNLARSFVYLARTDGKFPDLGKRRFRLPVKLILFGMLAFCLWMLYARFHDLDVPVAPSGAALLVPLRQHVAYCQVEGTIDKILVREGDKVEKGRLIATINPEQINQKIRAEAAQAAIYANEISRLGRESVEKPQLRAEINILRLRLKKSEVIIEQLEWQLGLLEIRSPMSGLIVTRDVEILAGKFVRPGDEICRIAAPEPLELQVKIRETDLAHVRLAALLTLYLDSAPDSPITLTVDAVSPQAVYDENSGTNVFIVKSVIAAPGENVRPGMKGIASITGEKMNLTALALRKLRLFVNSIRHQSF